MSACSESHFPWAANIDWTGDPSPESARFSQTFHPENAFISFYDSALDSLATFELLQSMENRAPQSGIIKKPGLAVLMVSDALDIIVGFHLNEKPPNLADPAWPHVDEGVIAISSGRMDIAGGGEAAVDVQMDPGSYAFRVYFSESGNIESQRLAVFFHKTEAEESGEIKVLKHDRW